MAWSFHWSRSKILTKGRPKCVKLFHFRSIGIAPWVHFCLFLSYLETLMQDLKGFYLKLPVFSFFFFLKKKKIYSRHRHLYSNVDWQEGVGGMGVTCNSKRGPLHIWHAVSTTQLPARPSTCILTIIRCKISIKLCLLYTEKTSFQYQQFYYDTSLPL